MPEHWRDPFMVWAQMDAQALVLRADRACESARDVRCRRRRASARGVAHSIDPSTEVRLRLSLERFLEP